MGLPTPEFGEYDTSLHGLGSLGDTDKQLTIRVAVNTKIFKFSWRSVLAREGSLVRFPAVCGGINFVTVVG